MVIRHHCCNICGRDFDTELHLEAHVDRRHAKSDIGWWVVVDDPGSDHAATDE